MRVSRRHLSISGVVVGLLVATVAVSAGSAFGATTYTVDNTSTLCSDSGAGTSAQPFCTIAAAAAKAVAGDTVLVSAGVYSGTSVNPANSGTALAPITFTASPGAAIVGGTRAFSLVGRSNIVISGFAITGTSSYGIAVSGGGNIAISKNKISFAGQPVAGSAAAGIFLSNLTGGRVWNNVTHDNSSHGIYLNGTTTGVSVLGNVSYHNAYQYQRAAVGINVTSPGNIIVHNVTYANEDSGIQVYTGANNTLVTGNLSYDNGDHGIDSHNVTGGRVIGNTVYRNCTTGINVEGTSSKFIVENNIAVNNATGAIINPTPINPPSAYVNKCNRRVGNIGVWDSAPATTTADYNLVWQTGAGAEYVWNGHIYQTRYALHTATGKEAHGIFANPLFKNAAAWNLRLTWTSVAIDSGNSGVSGEQISDIVGQRRVDDPQRPNTGAGPRRYDDRGAYEYKPVHS
jgi:parallel beta-helix repeat protein